MHLGVRQLFFTWIYFGNTAVTTTLLQDYHDDTGGIIWLGRTFADYQVAFVGSNLQQNSYRLRKGSRED